MNEHFNLFVAPGGTRPVKLKYDNVSPEVHSIVNVLITIDSKLHLFQN